MSRFSNIVIVSKLKAYCTDVEIADEDKIVVPIHEYYNHDLIIERLGAMDEKDRTDGEEFILTVLKLKKTAQDNKDRKMVSICDSVIKRAILGEGRC